MAEEKNYYYIETKHGRNFFSSWLSEKVTEEEAIQHMFEQAAEMGGDLVRASIKRKGLSDHGREG